MVKSAYVKDFFREIKRTFNRFISITVLVFLAAGFFSGIRAAKPDMQYSADIYMDETNMHDVRVVSTLGLTRQDVQALSALEGVSGAEGAYTLDAVVSRGGDTGIVKIHSLQSKINLPQLKSGRLPEAVGECAVEEALLTALGLKIGDSMAIEQLPEGMEEALSTGTLTVTGVVRSPLYMTKLSHGSSSLGSGSVTAFVLAPEESFSLDYYTDIYMTVEGVGDIMSYDGEYFDVVDAVHDRVEGIAPQRAQARYDDLTGEAKKQIDDAQSELDDAKKKLADGEEELRGAREEYEDGQQKLSKARQELEDGQREYDESYAETYSRLEDARQQLISGRDEAEQGRAAIQEAQAQLDERRQSAQEQLDMAKAELDAQAQQLLQARRQYAASLTEYEAQKAQWDALPPEQQELLPDTQAQLEAAQQQLAQTAAQLEDGQSALDSGYLELDAKQRQLDETIASGQGEINSKTAELERGDAQLAAGWDEYYTGMATAEREFDSARQELEDARAEISKGEKELEDARKKISDGENELEDNRQKVSDAQAEIDDAREKLGEIEPGKWYVLDRNSNTGYVTYGQDSDRMGAIGNVFPVLFFAVACLVCLTCMTRMVDEKRVELGSYKSLGFGGMKSSMKFVGYSALAALIGIISGVLIGMRLLPWIIMRTYRIIYDIPVMYTPIWKGIASVAAGACILCTAGATLISALSTLRESPASLLRPKAPAPGKRVLLERIAPLWRRMSFFGKVSARNILRYKKRFWMTLVGIAGCTALIVTGFGLRDSIMNITSLQFGQIQRYDLQAYFTDDATDGEIDGVRRLLDNYGAVGAYTLVEQTLADIESGSGVQSGYYYVPEDPSAISDFITLRHRNDHSPISLTDGGAVITEKLSELLKVGVGDTLSIVKDSRRYEVRVSDIAENYAYHYVFMTPAYYESVFAAEPEVNQALISDTDGGEETANAVSEELLKLSAVNYTVFFSSLADTFNKTLQSINAVVMIIIVAAAMLAFIVLYNLTSINITERTRELATLKVLGFRDREVTQYIIRENLVLTVMGIAVGMVGGKFLSGWLIRTVEVDFCMFSRDVTTASYVLAAAMTAVFSAVVNVLGHIRMRKIDMVQSLKSNE